MRKFSIVTLFFCLSSLSCENQAAELLKEEGFSDRRDNVVFAEPDTSVTTIHVFVALCDNKYQGIVPVPAKIGNGQDPDNNLYWGCALGIRTYFKKSGEWNLIKVQKPDSVILERLIFKHVSKNCYLVADAYNGRYIKQAIEDFLKSSCGLRKETLTINDNTIGIAGNSALLAYIGHNGLMDFQIGEKYRSADNRKRDAIILACYSKNYFSYHLNDANVNPLVWTTGLMCPEAYTLHDALSAWLNGETTGDVRTKAALAYSKYQKCSEKAAKNLLVTGW